MPPLIEFFTKMASAIFTLLLGKLLYDQTNSLWAFASAYGGEFLIVTLIQCYAGTISDRYSPCQILVIINVISFVAFISLSMTYSADSTFYLLIAAGIVYVARPFYRTSLFVLVKDVFKANELKIVNGKIAASSQLGQIVGLSMTGVMLSWYSESAVLYFMAVIYGVCLLASLLIKSKYAHQNHAEVTQKTALSWCDFINFTFGNRAFLIRLLSSFSIAVSLGGFYVLLAPLVANKFANDTQWLSWLSVSYAVGAIASGTLMKHFKSMLNKQSSDTALLINQCVSALAFLAFALFDQLSWLPILMFCFGVTTTLAAVSLAAYLQEMTLDGIAGRTAAIQNIIIAFGNAFAAFYCSCLFEWSFESAAIGLAFLLLLVSMVFLVVFAKHPIICNLQTTEILESGRN
ncbi:MFS transporter [Vibrio fluvialis]|uniref:MFS transporter n=1 Tax=Vibrio fluvialis TaxID=676 RepID=UPI003B9E0EA8